MELSGSERASIGAKSAAIAASPFVVQRPRSRTIAVGTRPIVENDGREGGCVYGSRLGEILELFCSGFAARDADAVMRLFAPDADLAMVTSEESLLRGPDEIAAFLQRYREGTTTYSWRWDRRDVSAAGPVGWLLAEGTETAAAEDREEKHLYRMSMVCENRDGRWLLVQVHGSSPQHG